MINNVFIFIVALYLVIRGATLATTYAGSLAEGFRLSKYTVGFIIVAIISILPETAISIQAAVSGIPAFGLGMLFGSNIADLTLVFAVIIWHAGRSLKVESKILKNHVVYPFLLLLPLILGADGYLSRLEGAALIVVGVVFYVLAFRNGTNDKRTVPSGHRMLKSFFMLVFGMVLLLFGAHFTVTSASSVALALGISPILVGMLIVGLGTTMPELFFSLRSMKKRDDSLAIGDLLGTVLADATIVVGILALVNPFSFPQRIIYVTGAFMLVAAIVLFQFMRSGRSISKKEAWFLFAFWLAFVIVEFLVNR
ncbi:MAG: hypothetical protein ABIO72_03315 [Patescibacteria group bacterium]